jgi:hypothetical protein
MAVSAETVWMVDLVLMAEMELQEQTVLMA